jgi:hypothetical protein
MVLSAINVRGRKTTGISDGPGDGTINNFANDVVPFPCIIQINMCLASSSDIIKNEHTKRTSANLNHPEPSFPSHPILYKPQQHPPSLLSNSTKQDLVIHPRRATCNKLTAMSASDAQIFVTSYLISGSPGYSKDNKNALKASSFAKVRAYRGNTRWEQGS